MADLQVKAEPRDQRLVLQLSGELSISTSDVFNQAVEKALADSGEHRIILDVSELSFVDSCGLGALISLLKQARSHAGFVHLAGVRAGLLELLFHSKFESLFRRFKNLEEATAADHDDPVAFDPLAPVLRISKTIRSNHLIVHLSGELIEISAEQLNQLVKSEDQALWQHGLILHLGELTKVDSAGLDCLTGINQQVRRSTGPVKLVAVPAFLIEQLHYAHQDVLFPRFDTVEDALTATD